MNLLQDTARKVAGMLGHESKLIQRIRPAYESLLDWSTGGQGIKWPINGVTYRIDPRQRYRLGQNYDAPVADFLRDRVKPGSICIDVGANVGVYVLQFAHWSRPTGRVIAFEPNPVARKILQKHIELNQLTERARVVPVAVAEALGEAILYALDADGMSRLGAPNQAIADRVSEIKVPVVTLDHYCQSEAILPDWLFIDIEGFEINALIGASELIKNRKKELGIVVEMHPDVWATANMSLAIAEETLAALNLRPLPLTGQNDPLKDYGLVYLENNETG